MPVADSRHWDLSIKVFLKPQTVTFSPVIKLFQLMFDPFCNFGTFKSQVHNHQTRKTRWTSAASSAKAWYSVVHWSRFVTFLFRFFRHPTYASGNHLRQYVEKTGVDPGNRFCNSFFCQGSPTSFLSNCEKNQTFENASLWWSGSASPYAHPPPSMYCHIKGAILQNTEEKFPGSKKFFLRQPSVFFGVNPTKYFIHSHFNFRNFLLLKKLEKKKLIDKFGNYSESKLLDL